MDEDEGVDEEGDEEGDGEGGSDEEGASVKSEVRELERGGTANLWKLSSRFAEDELGGMRRRVVRLCGGEKSSVIVCLQRIPGRWVMRNGEYCWKEQARRAGGAWLLGACGFPKLCNSIV